MTHLKREEYPCVRNLRRIVLKNEKTETMFPLRKKVHTMDNRCEEKYKVNFAKTERMKKSSIPYMQNELNIEVKNNMKKLRKPG